MQANDLEDMKKMCMRAVLRGLFGTNMEVRVKHEGTVSAVKQARTSVHRMSDEAEALLELIDGQEKQHPQPVDETYQALKTIIRNIQ